MLGMSQGLLLALRERVRQTDLQALVDEVFKGEVTVLQGFEHQLDSEEQEKREMVRFLMGMCSQGVKEEVVVRASQDGIEEWDCEF